MLEALALVMLGAAAGGAARFLITNFSSDLSHHHGFPYGTLIVNVAGCFLVGYVLTWVADHEHDRWRLLMATGFCGGFTTFSAFAFETMAYFREGQLVAMIGNVVLNNVLGFVALLAGIWLHKTSK
jgi:CrcB protein